MWTLNATNLWSVMSSNAHNAGLISIPSAQQFLYRTLHPWSIKQHHFTNNSAIALRKCKRIFLMLFIDKEKISEITLSISFFHKKKRIFWTESTKKTFLIQWGEKRWNGFVERSKTPLNKRNKRWKICCWTIINSWRRLSKKSSKIDKLYSINLYLIIAWLNPK